MVSWGVNLPHKNGPILLWLAPNLITSKSKPPPKPIRSSKSYKYDNYDKTKYKVSPYCKSFPLLLDPPGKPDHQATHCPTANFGPVSRGSITYSILITVFDTYLTPKVTGSLGLSQDLSDSECTVLTHFSMSVAREYVNLKKPYNQDIKVYVTTITFITKKKDFTWNPQTRRQSELKVFFKFNPLFVVLTFQIMYQ